mmetsp:Transcript_43017/g.125087  ORF Transcript_43017/g.125087 Transcript_43017/m.125087 type:complete len:213 (-) Transcript_43017:581-1219(-)
MPRASLSFFTSSAILSAKARTSASSALCFATIATNAPAGVGGAWGVFGGDADCGPSCACSLCGCIGCCPAKLASAAAAAASQHSAAAVRIASRSRSRASTTSVISSRVASKPMSPPPVFSRRRRISSIAWWRSAMSFTKACCCGGCCCCTRIWRTDCCCAPSRGERTMQGLHARTGGATRSEGDTERKGCLSATLVPQSGRVPDTIAMGGCD